MMNDIGTVFTPSLSGHWQGCLSIRLIFTVWKHPHSETLPPDSCLEGLSDNRPLFSTGAMFADSDLHQLFQRSEARACLYTEFEAVMNVLYQIGVEGYVSDFFL